MDEVKTSFQQGNSLISFENFLFFKNVCTFNAGGGFCVLKWSLLASFLLIGE